MRIIELGIEKLKPYKFNPRKNDGAVDAVANSIKEFGFKVPIIIDENNVIVAGHTRLKAAEKLGLKSVPAVIADDLTPEQVKAFRIADNKTAELADWDINLLNQEISEIDDIDLKNFGFTEEEIDNIFNSAISFEDELDEDGYYGDEREKTYNKYNLREYDEDLKTGFYDIPVIPKTNYIPQSLTGFNYVLNTEPQDFGAVHFYIDDYQFERIWQRPEFYIDKIKPWKAAVGLDFSMYLDMPMSMKIWNYYRSMLINQLMSKAGIEVIPAALWADRQTFSFCFDGMPKGGTFAVSTIGVKEDKECRKTWIDGFEEFLKKCEPDTILLYGGKIKNYDLSGLNIIEFSNSVTDRMKAEPGKNE